MKSFVCSKKIDYVGEEGPLKCYFAMGVTRMSADQRYEGPNGISFNTSGRASNFHPSNVTQHLNGPKGITRCFGLTLFIYPD